MLGERCMDIPTMFNVNRASPMIKSRTHSIFCNVKLSAGHPLCGLSRSDKCFPWQNPFTAALQSKYPYIFYHRFGTAHDEFPLLSHHHTTQSENESQRVIQKLCTFLWQHLCSYIAGSQSTKSFALNFSSVVH